MKQLLQTLYILTPNYYLSLDGENILIQESGKILKRIPLHNLDSVIAFGVAGVSPPLMGKCASMGIPIVFMSRSGKFYSRAEGQLKGNVILRRQQYRYADNDEKSLYIAKYMIAGKIHNSRYCFERTIRDHAPRIDADTMKQKSGMLFEMAKKALTAENMDSLRGMEGEAASVYFSMFDAMILQQKEAFYFHTRSKRPPLDCVNALLSFSYALMTNMCASALEAVGLDPYVGFMHTDRPGRCSLALDLVEEFRAPICDRFVLTLINRKKISEKHFEKQEDGAVLLNDDGRRVFLQEWQKRKMDEIKHPFLKEKMQIGILPYAQALLLARYIRGDIDCYPAMMWK